MPIAKSSEPAIDAETGAIAILTPDDRSTEATAKDSAVGVDERGSNYLSVLASNGQTQMAVPLDSVPTRGPIITTIDDTKVVAILVGSTLSYWPIDGSAEDQTDVALPVKGASNLLASEYGVLLEVSDTKLAVVSATGLDEIDALPLTTPVTLTAAGALSIEEDTGTWWLSLPDEAPTEVTPAPPTGATALSSVVCADPNHVVILWESNAPTEATYKQPGLLTAYRTTSGELVASVQVDSMASNLSAACPESTVSSLTAGDGFVLYDDGTEASLTLIDGLTPDTVADTVYGSIQGDKVQVSPDGTPTSLTASTLIPVAYRDDELYVISQWQLYPLPPE